MSRKRLLLLSLVSLAALAAWGFAPGKTTPSCAEAAASATNPCELDMAGIWVTFNGTQAKPQGATAGWKVLVPPPCYRISTIEVTFNFTLANGKIVSKTTTAVPGVASSTASVSWPGPAGPLDPPERPKLVSATVKATAVPIDPQKIKSVVVSANI